MALILYSISSDNTSPTKIRQRHNKITKYNIVNDNLLIMINTIFAYKFDALTACSRERIPSPTSLLYSLPYKSETIVTACGQLPALAYRLHTRLSLNKFKRKFTASLSVNTSAIISTRRI